MQPLDGHINRMIACIRQFRVFLAKAGDMKIFFRNFRYFFAALVGISLSIWYTAYFLLHPPVYAFRLKAEGLGFALWPSEQILTLRWVLALLAVLLAGVAVALCLWAMKKTQHEQPRIRRAIDVLAPLSVLPLACVPLFTADIIPPILSTNAPLFILLGALSLSLAKLFTPLLDAGAASNQKTWPWAWGIFLIALIGYAHGGYQFSKAVGEHVGDEGHYLIQAQSLYEDGNLDIKKQLMNSLGLDDSSHINRDYYHVASQSRGDAWYSWHPYGLPLLLTPSWKWGLGGRHIVLGIISGAGLAGLFLLCRRMGAGTAASLLAVLSLGTSVFWVLYSFRALPEVLGATLLIWAFWAVAAQRDRPWLAMLIATACCVYLPFAHIRFVPMSLMGIGLFGVFGLLGEESLKSKLLRLSAFFLLCLGGYGVYYGMQTSMFIGGSQAPIMEFLFAYPFGAWGTLASDRGLISLLPVFYWLSGATVVWLFVDKKNRLLCLGIFTTFLAALLICAANRVWTGGSSMPGRYLVAVIPLLFVGAAVMLERSKLPARALFIYLSIFSSMLLFLVWKHLPDVGRQFILPLQALSSFPSLQDIYFPHAYFYGDRADIILSSMYVLMSIVLVGIVIIIKYRSFFAYFLSIFIFVIGLFVQNSLGVDRFSLQKYVELLEKHNELSQISVDNIIKIQHAEARMPWSTILDLQRMRSYTGKNYNNDISARIALSGIDRKGELAWGNYFYIFPGTFSVNYQLEVSNCIDACKVSTLDVTENYNNSIIASKNIYCENSSQINQLFITTDRFVVIEPRIYYHGCGDIVVKSLFVQEVVEY